MVNTLLLFIVLLGIASTISRRYLIWRGNQAIQRHLKQFTPLTYLDTYVEALPQLSIGKKPLDEITLLVHGYSTSPSDYEHLYPHLEKNNIAYYAPILSGFATANLHLLYSITAADWLRDVINAYDIAAKLANKINIIGHSTGATLGLMVANYRPVHKLILLSPSTASKKDQLIKTLLSLPIISQILCYIIPMFIKPIRPKRVTNVDTLDPATAPKTFHYPALPTLSLSVAWALQDQVNFGSIQAEKLYLLYGVHDLTADPKKTQLALEQQNIPYQVIEYPRSAHNITEDYDRDAVISDIVRILKE